jgi:hypothetical protein
MSITGSTFLQQQSLFAPPSCPACQIPMIVKEGPSVRFFGCPNHPKCHWMCWSNGVGGPKGEPFDGDLQRKNERANRLVRGLSEAYSLFQTYDTRHSERPPFAKDLQSLLGRDLGEGVQSFTHGECLAIDLFCDALQEGLRRDLFGEQPIPVRKRAARKKTPAAVVTLKQIEGEAR